MLPPESFHCYFFLYLFLPFLNALLFSTILLFLPVLRPSMLLSLHPAPASEPPWKKLVFTSRLIVRTGNHPKIHIYGMGWTNRDITSFDILPFTVRNIKGASQYMTWWLSLLDCRPRPWAGQGACRPPARTHLTTRYHITRYHITRYHITRYLITRYLITRYHITSPKSQGGDMMLFCQLVTSNIKYQCKFLTSTIPAAPSTIAAAWWISSSFKLLYTFHFKISSTF